MPKSAQRQALITVSGIAGFWAVLEGGEANSDVTRVWDGGAHDPDILTAPRQISDVTVRRPYDPDRDNTVYRSAIAHVGRRPHSVTFQPTDRDLIPVSNPTVYHGILIGATRPDANAGSGDAMELTLTFAIQRVS